MNNLSRHVASVKNKFRKLNKSKSRNSTARQAYLEQEVELEGARKRDTEGVSSVSTGIPQAGG